MYIKLISREFCDYDNKEFIMPISPNSLIAVINKNKDKKLVATRIIETNPKALPVIPKLISDKDTARSMSTKDELLNVNKSILESIYNKIKTTKNNNKNIIKLFPDIELAIQILVSSILSPKKMTDIQLNYKLDKDFHINTTSLTNIIEKVKLYINKEYDLEDKLPEIIREALFQSGAYALAIIPESSVDEVINTDLLPSYSTEDFKQRADILINSMVKPINILSLKSNTVDLDPNPKSDNLVKHLASESFFRLTDNVSVLRFNKIREKIHKSIVKNSLKQNISISMESAEKIDYLDIFRQKSSVASNKDIEFLKTKTETKRKTIGKPMVLKIPTEAVIPVFIPGDETEHIGYFVLLDETGKPLNTEIKDADINQLNSIINQSNTQSQLSPAQKAYNSLVGDANANIDINQLFNLYKEVLERQIYSSIKNSLYSSNVEIANKNDIYFLMFTRALSEQKTSILYIPKELLIYFAFYYNELGIGKSLLENLSVLSSLRAILLFSKVMAYAKQSIDVTKVNIALDPNDPDPEKTIEQVQDSVLKLRQNFFPLGINNPVDLVNWIQRAGLQFSYSNNPLLPNIQIDFENVQLQHTVPSTELDEDLRKQTILALGLTPETIDNGFTPEFATTVVNNNILLSKRISVYQKTLTGHLSNFLSTVIFNDEDLRSDLRKEVLENLDSLNEQLSDEEKQLITKSKDEFVEYFINLFAEHLTIELPKPENTNLVNLAAEFDTYKENLDKVIDAVISTEMFSENIAGELANHIDTIRNVYKNYLLRQWMATNNFYPEVLEFGKQNNEEDDADKLIELIEEHLTGTMRNSDKLINLLQTYKDAINTDLQKVSGDGASASGSSGSYSDSGSGDEDGGESGRGGDNLGGMDFGIGDDDADLTI